MPYRLMEIELSEAPAAIAFEATQDGLGLVARWKGRLAGFRIARATPGASIPSEELTEICSRRFGSRALALEIETALVRRWSDDDPPPAPSLSIAICSKDRAKRLERLLDSLQQVRSSSRFRSTEILVIDNASVDAA